MAELDNLRFIVEGLGLVSKILDRFLQILQKKSTINNNNNNDNNDNDNNDYKN